MDEYISKIIAEFNEHARKADELAANPQVGNLHEEGFHAFMANAISSAVTRSTNQELKNRFSKEAIS